MIVGGFVVLGTAFFLNKTTLAAQLDAWQLLPRSEAYTELYFTNHHQRLAPMFGAPQKVAFTIHNLQQQTTTYHYTISATSTNQQTSHLGEGSTTLNHNQSWATEPTITIPDLGGRVAVTIQLSYKGLAWGNDTPSPHTQSIHRWITLEGSEQAYDSH